MTLVRATAVFALVCGLGACASFVNKGDYADYRKVRLAQTSDERLLAIQHYVSAHPDGHWASDLVAEQRAREAEVYDSGKATRAGLELYVRAYPSGHFVEQARARLAAITQIEQRKAEEQAAAERALADKRARDEELRRTWVTRFFSYWTDTLLAVHQWGEPIADIARQNPEFSRAFGKSPRPQCNATECVKHYRSNFGVPVVGGTRVERTIELTLRLLLREGRVTRVELLFPRRGFSRWFELENRRAVIDEDPQMRNEAIAWAIDKVKPWLAKIGEQRTEIADVVFEPVLTPSLGPNGETTDTTATDPSSQVLGASNDTTRDAPQEIPSEQPAPDMVMGPILIPESGHQVQTMTPSVPAPTAEGVGEVMILGPIGAGPETDGETMVLGSIGEDVTSPNPTTAGATTATTTPALQTYALSSGDLRVVVFADSPGGWDGLRIEKVAPAAARTATPKRATR